MSIITDKHTKFFKKQTVLMGAFESMFATGSQAQIQTSNKTVFPWIICYVHSQRNEIANFRKGKNAEK